MFSVEKVCNRACTNKFNHARAALTGQHTLSANACLLSIATVCARNLRLILPLYMTHTWYCVHTT